MEAVPSLERTQPRLTGVLLTFAVRWPSLSSRANSRSVALSSFLMPLVWHSPDDITKVLKIAFDARPGAIAVSLALREPKYQETAAYCHFGRDAVTKDGMKYFEWENPQDLSKYTKMSAEQINVELTGSNYLTKWVD